MQNFIVLKGVVHTDSSAALGIVSRVGIGRTRLIQVQYLWLQGRLLENDLKAVKFGGKFNVSDLMTKYLRREDIDKILHIMGMQVHDSQSCVALIQYNAFDTGEGVDCWIRTQKEQCSGSDVGGRVKEHDKLKKEVIGPTWNDIVPSIIPPTWSKSSETCATENQRICGRKQQQVCSFTTGGARPKR